MSIKSLSRSVLCLCIAWCMYVSMCALGVSNYLFIEVALDSVGVSHRALGLLDLILL